MSRPLDPRLQPLKELLQDVIELTIVDPYILLSEDDLPLILPSSLKPKFRTLKTE